MSRFAGSRVLVVGGTSGIGAALVKSLAADGARVVFTGRDEGRGSALASRTGASFLSADATDPAAVRANGDKAMRILGGLDGLVLSAAVLHRAPISETDDESWDELIETNVLGPIRYAQTCLPALRESQGAVVALGSGTAVWPELALGAYSVTKRAVLALTQMIAVHLGPSGVRVNAVCPGDTAEGMRQSDSTSTRPPPVVPPLGRVADPVDVVSAIRFLLSDEASFCTGATLVLDGGMRAALRAGKVFA
jgi:NAD(P)-dependent dehydrogenase (short-subunit alcohol dehydrogenase family)